MCVLVDNQLLEWMKTGGVDNFDEKCLNPASLDLRWSGRRKRACKDSAELHWESINDPAVPFMRGNLYLIDTIEFIRIPKYCIGILALKSSLGRVGFEHLHAGFFDPGFEGTATLEVVVMSPSPIYLEPKQKIVQIVLFLLAGKPDKLYGIHTGRYQGQCEPQEARANGGTCARS